MKKVIHHVVCWGNHNNVTITDTTTPKKQANANKKTLKIVIIGVVTFIGIFIAANACLKNVETFLCALEAIVKIATIIANI